MRRDKKTAPLEEQPYISYRNIRNHRVRNITGHLRVSIPYRNIRNSIQVAHIVTTLFQSLIGTFVTSRSLLLSCMKVSIPYRNIRNRLHSSSSSILKVSIPYRNIRNAMHQLQPRVFSVSIPYRNIRNCIYTFYAVTL